MTKKSIPFSVELLENVVKKYPTPLHVYDEEAILDNARDIYKKFSWVPGGFKNYFAVKACPNPYIMELLASEGMGFDCSSMAELLLAEKAGVRGEDIMFTSNDTPASEYKKAMELGAIINLDDINHIAYIEKHAGIPDLLSFRYNPGPLKTGNAIIGMPEDAKYGLMRDQIIEACKVCSGKNVRQFGLHTMVASNELDPEYFVETAKLLFDLVVEINKKTGVRISFVNLGGGVGIPYKSDQVAVDLQCVSRGVQALYKTIIVGAGLDPLNIVTENGRVITGPYGYLLTRVLHKKHTYKEYVGTDASMANLMRPGMYGAYHHITVLGKENSNKQKIYDVTGSLCENNDKFAIDRKLPLVEIGDLLAIHDTGAHGHSMGFNYNGKLRSAEVILKRNGEAKLIRRAETYDDHFATLDFSGLKKFRLSERS